MGEDVTRHLVGARGVPMKLAEPYPAVLEIRGEVHVADADFQRVRTPSARRLVCASSKTLGTPRRERCERSSSTIIKCRCVFWA